MVLAKRRTNKTVCVRLIPLRPVPPPGCFEASSTLSVCVALPLCVAAESTKIKSTEGESARAARALVPSPLLARIPPCPITSPICCCCCCSLYHCMCVSRGWLASPQSSTHIYQGKCPTRCPPPMPHPRKASIIPKSPLSLCTRRTILNDHLPTMQPNPQPAGQK